MPTLAPTPRFRAFTAGSATSPALPLVGGKVYAYAAGTTTPKDTYTSQDGLTANTNPVVLNARGEADIWFGPGAYKLVIRDIFGVQQGAEIDNLASPPTLVELVAEFFEPDGANLIGLASNFPYSAGSVGERFREFVSITEPRFGAVSGSSATAAITAATAYCNTQDIDGDAGGPYGGVCLVIPRGTWPLTADTPLPRNVICYGNITGAYNLTVTRLKRCSYVGIRAAQMLIDGMWFGSMRDCYITALTIKGGGTGFGTFWNVFDNVEGSVTIDLSNWSVNQNRFSGRGNFTTIGTTGTLLDGHGNNTSNWDFTPGQCSNTSTIQQDSLLIGSYYEAGADIVGPYHVIGAQGDANGPPTVNRRNHVFAMYDGIEKNRSDFIAAGAGNLVLGGEWDYLNASGYPAGLTMLAATAVVASDLTEPFGMKAKVGAVFTAAFSGFAIVLPPCQSGAFSLVLAYQSPNDFAAIEVNRGAGGVTSGGASMRLIDAANSWKLLRLSGKANTASPTTVNLFALSAAGSKSINIGGIFATQEKAAFLPSARPVREQQGTVTQGYVAAPPFVDIAVVFPRAFSATPAVQCSMIDSGAQTVNMSKIIVRSPTTAGFTARVYYATDFTGILSWFAKGLD